MIVDDVQKKFEIPDTGMFVGTIHDVVDVGPVQTNYGVKNKVRIIWLLNANDSEGNPYRAMRQENASMNEKSKLYDLVKQLLQTAPPVPYDLENLIGVTSQLLIQKETNAKNGKTYANIKAFLPLVAGQNPVPAPAGFVRSKDKVPFNNQAQSNAPAAQAQAAAPAVQQAAVAAQPAAVAAAVAGQTAPVAEAQQEEIQF